MITYPSTNGVFEDNVKDVCQMVHDAGGQVTTHYHPSYNTYIYHVTLGGLKSHIRGPIFLYRYPHYILLAMHFDL